MADLTYTENATVTSVGSSTTTVTLAPATIGRRWVAICNDSTAVLYVKFGAGASTSSFTYKVPADATLEHPGNGSLYTGIITGVWASVNGNALVTVT